MATPTPTTALDARYGEVDTATDWAEARDRMAQAELYWLTTVRADGRPHVTPLIGVWVDDALCFCTGAEEQKTRNIAAHSQCLMTTGCNTLHEGMDIVVEGTAVNVVDDAKLQRIADAYLAKYGEDWHFEVENGALAHRGGRALAFEIAPVTAYGFGKHPYSHTRWTF